MKLRVSHLTRYQYEHTVSFSMHQLYLRPRETHHLRLTRFSLNTFPSAKIVQARDAWDNNYIRAHFWDHSTTLNIRTEFEIESTETNPFDFILPVNATHSPFDYEPAEVVALTRYMTLLRDSDRIHLQRWLNDHFHARPKEIVAQLTALNQLVYSSFKVDTNRQPGSSPQSPLSTIDKGIGSSSDIVTLYIDLVRILGFAARFVSGYRYVYPDGAEPKPESLHAWAEVHLPGVGWKGFDPNHGIVCNEQYIPVAHSARSEWANPIQGSYFSASAVSSTLLSHVRVEKLSDE